MNALARVRGSNWLVLLLAVAGMLLAPIFGQLAVSGDIVVAGVAVGAVIGLFLLCFPAASVWLIIALPLGLGMVLALLGPVASKLSWAVSLLSMLLLAPSVLRLIWKRQAPAFVWCALLLMVFGITVSVIQGIDAKQLVAGFKRYFQGYGLFMALAVMAFASTQVDRWRQVFTWLAVAQLPVCLAQLLILVPLRGGFNSGQNTDVVAGTFGGNLDGGSNNSDMVLMQITAAAFLAARWQQGLLSGRKLLTSLLVMLLPLAMGETKIVVLLLPLAMLVLFRGEVMRKPLTYLPMLLLTLLLSIALAYLYAEFYMGQPLDYVIDNTIRYNFQDMGYGTYLLNRWTVLTFWFEHQSLYDPLATLFGHGLSASYTSQTPGGSGQIAELYPLHGIDLTAVSALLWDLGVVGLSMFVLLHLLAWRAANQVIRHTRSAEAQADARAIQVAIAILFVYLNYNQSPINLVTTEVLMASYLGYLSILVRQHGQAPALPDR